MIIDIWKSEPIVVSINSRNRIGFYCFLCKGIAQDLMCFECAYKGRCNSTRTWKNSTTLDVDFDMSQIDDAKAFK